MDDRDLNNSDYYTSANALAVLALLAKADASMCLQHGLAWTIARVHANQRGHSIHVALLLRVLADNPSLMLAKDLADWCSNNPQPLLACCRLIDAGQVDAALQSLARAYGLSAPDANTQPGRDAYSYCARILQSLSDLFYRRP